MVEKGTAQDDMVEKGSAQDDIVEKGSAQDDMVEKGSAQDDMVMIPPPPDELAAIAAALEIYARHVTAATAANGISGWTLAMRRPELEFDELLALRHSCSTRS